MRARLRACAPSALAVTAAGLLVACEHSSILGLRDMSSGRQSARGTGPPVSQAELQLDVERVALVFMDRVGQALEPLADRDIGTAREKALLRRVVLYNSSVVEIATGPYPELNTLDMIVFMVLCRSVLERHWIPERFGEDAQGLVEAFTVSERELWLVAGKLLDARQRAELRRMIAQWEREHPTQFRVEGVRFLEFSEHAGKVSRERARLTSGFLGQVRSATMAADQALLLSERGLFLAHRMPSMMRLQARLGALEVTSDALAQVDGNAVDAADRVVRRWMAYLLLLGLGWAVCFWGGYALVRRRR